MYADNTFRSSLAWTNDHTFCVMYICVDFIENSNSFLGWKCQSTLRNYFMMRRSDVCKTCILRKRAQTGQQVAPHTFVWVEAPPNWPLIQCSPLCGSGALLTMLSAICIRMVKNSSLALAVQHNETPAEAPPHLLPCCNTLTFAPCLQSYSTAFFFYYWRMHHKLAVTRKPIYCMFTVSLTCHERRLLNSRKMCNFAEGTNWLFFFFILPLSLHQCLIWIHVRWHPSPPFFTAALMFLPLFIPFLTPTFGRQSQEATSSPWHK